ncbi:hypothetical protein YC2023_068019 [Brassica napus]
MCAKSSQCHTQLIPSKSAISFPGLAGWIHGNIPLPTSTALLLSGSNESSMTEERLDAFMVGSVHDYIQKNIQRAPERRKEYFAKLRVVSVTWCGRCVGYPLAETKDRHKRRTLEIK